jgi:MOSC domain-containing protein YiiM
VTVLHLALADLESGLDHVAASPADEGTLHLVVRRPTVDEREVLDRGQLDVDHGLIGDSWEARGGDPERQLTLMNWRAISLIAPEADRRPLAGDQLYVDLDLGSANLPAGSRVAIGEAVVEVTAPPHQGCSKFAARFGGDALRLVNSPAGVALNLRGVNARVVTGGAVAPGDPVRKLA